MAAEARSTPDRSLIPPFQDGEVLEIHRTVNGQRVIMIVNATATSALGPDRIVLNGWMATWGASAHADGRVQRQADSIDRLLRHVKVHCNDPGNCEEFRATERGNTNGTEGNADAAAPEHHQV